MTSLPRFSVVICNYNYAALVGAAIRSALSQDYPPERLQVIVVDDGSTDGSREVYAAFSADQRFHLVLQENRGQSAAFAAGVHVADGDYVCLLDSDDVYLPHKLARVAAFIAGLDESPDTLFLCHDLAIENSQSGPAVTEPMSWFDLTQISEAPDCLTLDQPVTHFPFSIPCGLVFSRTLIAQCLDALPTWDFRRGADGIICPAIFLQTGRVHYLREQLGVYRIHGANEFASIVNGRYTPRFNPLARGPKTQRFLEHWLDTLIQTPAERMRALHYLRQREHLVRRPSASRGLREPAVQVFVLADDLDAQRAEESALNSLQSHAPVHIDVCLLAGRSELAAMAAAWHASDAQYVVYVRAGDRLDREFVEQHLYVRQHGALAGLSCSDLRLVDAQGQLVHTAVMRNSGAWRQALQPVPPMVTGLRDWVASPWSTAMFRRDALLGRMFACADSAPPDLQNAGFWLSCQFAHHTNGMVRLRETLSSCALMPDASASYGQLSVVNNLHGSPCTPAIAPAATWLQRFYAQERRLFDQHLPPAWHARFAPWLAAQQQANNPEAGP